MTFNLFSTLLPTTTQVYQAGDLVELADGKIGTIQYIDFGSERTGYIDGLDRAIVHGPATSDGYPRFIAHVTVDEVVSRV